MQAGPIPTGTRPWSCCLPSLASSPLALPLLLLDELAACRPNSVQNALKAFGWPWQLWLASTFQAFGSASVPGCPCYFRSIFLSLSFPQCARDLVLASPHNLLKPQAPAPCPDLCAEEVSVIRESR